MVHAPHEIGMIGPRLHLQFSISRGWFCGSRISPCTRVKNPKIGKEDFGVEKPLFPSPQKGGFESKKSPCRYRPPQGKWGVLDSKRPFLGWGEKGFFDSETLFSQFWGQDLWSACPPRRPEYQKQLKWRKSDSKVTLRGRPQSDSKMTEKWLFQAFWVIFESLWGRPLKVTFESLFRHFNCFWYSGLLGGHALHKSLTPVQGGRIRKFPDNPYPLN